MTWLRSFRSAKTAIRPALRAAQGFADHLNRVLNTTVSDSRLSLLSVPDDPDQDVFLLARFDREQQRIPIDLFGTPRSLFVQQVVRVVDDDSGLGTLETGKRCSTVSYRYRLDDGGAPLIRWEYNREPPRQEYDYPLAHVHVHAELPDGTPLEGLHISTERISLELVLWHLLSEPTWGLVPRSDDWREILRESIADFVERRTYP